MHCVILAGGSGTRFWPFSRKDNPKQLLNIVGERSMLQITVDRLRKLKSTSEIYIITRQELYDPIIRNIENIDPENIIIEPSAKNTAPAIGLVAQKIFLKNKNAIMGVFPADHLIVGHKNFEKSLDRAYRLVKKKNNLVTIGIKPTYPSTAYGYIQYEPGDNKNKIGYHVKTFAEKPHEKLAKRFLKSGDFLWNAGIFVWQVDTLLSSLEKHMPELYDALIEIRGYIENSKSIDEIWNNIMPQSIDYGLMEKANNIFVIPADFDWNDLGSWGALYNVFSKKDGENIVRGSGTVLDGKSNFIQSNGRFTAVIGLDNLVVVNTQDATLVVPKDKVERVKDLVGWLEKNDLKKLL
jgi:mannose-1-phosphate guanylyltransferase